MTQLNRNICWRVWCVWCGWHDWSLCNNSRSMQCSVEACVINHENVFLSQWAWWNYQKLLHSSGKVGHISHLNCIHVIQFDMTGIEAIVTSWWGYCEKVCVHIHVKQFDRTRLGAKVACVLSYSIYYYYFSLEWYYLCSLRFGGNLKLSCELPCCTYYYCCSYYDYYWSLTHAMHGPIEQRDEEMIVNSIIRLL